MIKKKKKRVSLQFLTANQNLLRRRSNVNEQSQIVIPLIKTFELKVQGKTKD